jgi:flagellin FlaB
MKAKGTKLVRNEDADVGIGTLIIFIAMVLVAAVAAAVLIQTSGILQQKAQQTGKEATAEVSSNLKVVSVVGNRSSDNPVNTINVTLQLTAGGADIDFKTVVVKYINETSSVTLNYSGTSAEGTNFTYHEDRSISGTPDTVLQAGDLGVISINLTATGQQLDVRKKGTIQVIPETGTMITKEIVAPATFGASTTVQLFP